MIPPDLMFWSDSSDEGWGAHLADTGVSGLWSQTDRALSINLRELIAVRLGMRHFLPRLQGQVVVVFSVSSTTAAYLRKQGGNSVFSPQSRDSDHPKVGRGAPDHLGASVHLRTPQRSGKLVVQTSDGADLLC